MSFLGNVCVRLVCGEFSLTPFNFYEFHEGIYAHVYTVLYNILYYTILNGTTVLSTTTIGPGPTSTFFYISGFGAK